ncbi:PREDICTED: protein SIEVE ELEMENT OCCLUSION B-like [Ipomoea nil]|uniref:protein SIEVE ELEMENT OCCLUSION B-like n=1 Tax=Ipomoea nil TaxID=35883 RepID=UPI000901137A|nr:PREDICTED: protein SIEVE ELEMENT OCCLUSION B-like [Ipomoea nil]
MLMPQKCIQKELSYQVRQLSFEVVFKSLNNIDYHSITIHLLSMLSTYPWDTKVVMMLAAFSLICGDFINISQHCHWNKLANKLRLFKQNLIVASSEKIYDDSIVKLIINFVKCVNELNQPPSFSPPQPVILATYWITRSILICTQCILCVESKNDVMEESTLIAKSKTILSACYPLLEVKRAEKSYKALLHGFSHSHNNLDVLKLIFNVNDDSEVIFHSSGIPRHVPFSELKDTRVLLIIVSDTNLSEAAFLYHHMSKFKISPWIILIPIIDYPQLWTDARMPSVRIITGLKLLDPCKRITPQFIRFVKERCAPSFQSGGEPIVISLDSRGRLVHINALQMILTWREDLAFDTLTVGSGNNIISLLQKELTEMTLGVGSVIDDIEERKRDLVNRIRNTIDDWRNDINMRIKDLDSSYNYTSKNEEMLWDKETWNLKLLGKVDSGRLLLLVLGYPGSDTYNIDYWIENWTTMKYDIFFCGGNDAKCIQELATKVKEVNFEIQLDIKFAYIGNNKKAKSLVKNMGGYALSSNNAEYLWFWTRLRSAFLSRINYLNKTGHIEDEDKIFLGLQKLLAYEAKNTTFGAWVLLSKGEEVIACDLGDKMMRVMNAYQKWKSNIRSKGFSQAFKDCYEKLASSQDQHSCCTLEYPLTLDKIPEDVNCPQCSHNMHQFITFTCCHDCHHGYDDHY